MTDLSHPTPWLATDGLWPDPPHAVPPPAAPRPRMEARFDAAFTAALALREKQMQQAYRPVIGIHKWFARRPGTLFRNLLLAEFNGVEAPARAFFRAHNLRGVIADPFMGGGTPLIEANRLGFHVLGMDINPMAFWIVRQELEPFDDAAFALAAEQVATDVDTQIRLLYETVCLECDAPAIVKYFLWVKTLACPSCGLRNDLFPGYLLAGASRHPQHVLACADCGALVELDHQPHANAPARCPQCGGRVQIEGPARRNKMPCRGCGHVFKYPDPATGAPQHRMWAIEYHCARCKPHHAGRFFKAPGDADLQRMTDAEARFALAPNLHIPQQAIPEGDETNRLHRWGYRFYREMFNHRQLLGLGLLQERISAVSASPVRHALFTVFSDILRYQNMLCRYDIYALKSQDIFAVHGFPVGLVQCENNLLGIPGVGAGGFRHFVEKYRRAKAYCAQPFETRQQGGRNQVISIAGETIQAEPVTHFPAGDSRQANLRCATATAAELPPQSLDGVFTDPPYFANVQYAELIDFCYVWLRQNLAPEFPEFRPETTRAAEELTGNTTMGRDLAHFTAGLSRIFTHFAAALKPGAPFVFTYHHNDLAAYAPLVVALLDAGLLCTAVLAAPAEMGASLHINNTASSILDSVFVSRREWDSLPPLPSPEQLTALLSENCRQVAIGGVSVSSGDARCLFSGHIARLCVQQLCPTWDRTRPSSARLADVQEALTALMARYNVGDPIGAVINPLKDAKPRQLQLLEEPGAPSV